MAIFKPYQLASREAHPDNTIININDQRIGNGLTFIAGLCSVETEETTLRIAARLKSLGINLFRAGAYKPRTSPYSFQGLGKKGLAILDAVKKETGMSIITEVMDAETLDQTCDIADIIQIGTRNMANYPLLKAIGKINKPVILKRGIAATLDEFLMAAEYILLGGNNNVVLCERGIRTFTNHSRATLDIAAIPALKEKTHLPIIVDPSHAAGVSSLVEPLSLAAVAAGSSALLIEVHDNPEHAYSDGQQALLPHQLETLMYKAKQIHRASCSLPSDEQVVNLQKENLAAKS